MNPKLFDAINKTHTHLAGEFGLPENYPRPEYTDNLLFYIQRNHNRNTVVYEVNRNANGHVNEEFPINVFWIRYDDSGEVKELNYIQNKLAYGYDFKKINNHCYEFQLVSYRKLTFYFGRCDVSTDFRCFTHIDGNLSRVTNIYVYVEDLGLFPNVKFIELYGTSIDSDEPAYEKLVIK